MAFKTFKTKREVVTLEALAGRVAGRKTAMGDIEIPRNQGKRRTGSKRALLKAIKDAGGVW
jgi:hypothetical protein